MQDKNKKATIIVLISSIGLIILGLNQVFEIFEFSNTKISPILTIVFSLLNFIFIYKWINPSENKIK
jgi:hypothetical protein